ncbi:MAG: YkgJ family cysteine cluster protein [Candidatus Diapherotrites archaeon]|uniref:YkgJ family cysteine cluster protein n=2 Tax=Candidatus Iainarchaeum sp. TaxID=3101447 RepID=A0A8T4LBC0_9ARCH|nr:YkgJ family cysteine cluster protein [Candidatus Diapherotrites archaeon]
MASEARPAIVPFKCTECGKCCKEFYHNQSYGHFFVLDNGLPLNLAEKEIFEREAKRQGKQVDIRWGRVVWDELSGQAIGVSWCSASEPCLFLREDNRCANYAHRPVYCRAFPVRPAFVEPDTGLVKFAGTSCPDDFFPASFPEHRERRVSNRELAQAYHRYYADDYAWARVKEELEKRLVQFVDELIGEGIIKPLAVSQEGETRVRGKPVMSLDEFLEGKGFQRKALLEKLFSIDFPAVKERVLAEVRAGEALP